MSPAGPAPILGPNRHERQPAIAVSMLGPSYLSDGAATVALIAMHLAVGAVLIKGLFEIPAFAPGR